jgi:hypothetical protein
VEREKTTPVQTRNKNKNSTVTPSRMEEDEPSLRPSGACVSLRLTTAAAEAAASYKQQQQQQHASYQVCWAAGAPLRSPGRVAMGLQVVASQEQERRHEPRVIVATATERRGTGALAVWSAAVVLPGAHWGRPLWVQGMAQKQQHLHACVSMWSKTNTRATSCCMPLLHVLPRKHSWSVHSSFKRRHGERRARHRAAWRAAVAAGGRSWCCQQ